MDLPRATALRDLPPEQDSAHQTGPLLLLPAFRPSPLTTNIHYLASLSSECLAGQNGPGMSPFSSELAKSWEPGPPPLRPHAFMCETLPGLRTSFGGKGLRKSKARNQTIQAGKPRGPFKTKAGHDKMMFVFVTLTAVGCSNTETSLLHKTRQPFKLSSHFV